MTLIGEVFILQICVTIMTAVRFSWYFLPAAYTKTISTSDARVSEILVYSLSRQRERKRDDRPPSFSSLPRLSTRFVRLTEQRIRHDVTSGRNVCAGRLLCGKERCEIRLAALRHIARMELKRVSCGCFGGRSFAMSPLISLAPTHDACSWIGILSYVLTPRYSPSYFAIKNFYCIAHKPLPLYRLKCDTRCS